MTITFVGYVAAALLSRCLPRSLAYMVGRQVGYMFHDRDRTGREAVEANLRVILHHTGRRVDDAALRRMVRETFCLFGEYVVDFFKFERLSGDRLHRLVTIQNQEIFEEAYRKDRGVLAITAHLGSWEIAGAAVVGLGYPVQAVALPSEDKATNAMFQRFRERRGIRVIEYGNAAKGVIRALRSREIVALLADRDYSGHNDTLDFFGGPARLPTGPARLAASTGVDVIPAFITRQPGDRFLLRFMPSINPDRTRDVEEMRRRIRDVLEVAIGECPSQWFMFRKFWNGNGRLENGGLTRGRA